MSRTASIGIKNLRSLKHSSCATYDVNSNISNRQYFTIEYYNTSPEPCRAHADFHFVRLIGKVFVEYDTRDSAQKAALSLAGRQFGDNIVKVEYVNEEKFARKEFD